MLSRLVLHQAPSQTPIAINKHSLPLKNQAIFELKIADHPFYVVAALN